MYSIAALVWKPLGCLPINLEPKGLSCVRLRNQCYDSPPMISLSSIEDNAFRVNKTPFERLGNLAPLRFPDCQREVIAG